MYKNRLLYSTGFIYIQVNVGATDGRRRDMLGRGGHMQEDDKREHREKKKTLHHISPLTQTRRHTHVLAFEYAY